MTKLSMLPHFIKERILMHRISLDPCMMDILSAIQAPHILTLVQEECPKEWMKSIHWCDLIHHSDKKAVQMLLDHPEWINWTLSHSHLINQSLLPILTETKTQQMHPTSRLYINHIECLIQYMNRPPPLI